MTELAAELEIIKSEYADTQSGPHTRILVRAQHRISREMVQEIRWAEGRMREQICKRLAGQISELLLQEWNRAEKSQNPTAL